MSNTQTAWIVAAVIIAAIIIGSMISNKASEAVEQYEYTPPPVLDHQEVMEERAMDCIAAGHTWTGFACNYATTP